MNFTDIRRCFNGSIYFWILFATPLAAATARIYVLNNAGDNVDVIDTVTNKVVQVIGGIEVPHGVTFSPDGSRAYITVESENALDVVDTKAGKIIKKIALDGRPNLPAVTRDGKRIFVCIAENPPRGAIDIIDSATLEKVKTIPMKNWMHDIFMTPDGKYAVAGSPGGKFAVAIDLQTDKPIWEMNFDRSVFTMAFETAPDGSTRRLFIQLRGLNGFAVVDFATHEEVTRINLPSEPTGFITDTPSHGMGVSPDGKTLWVNSGSANSVFAYSLPELKLLGHVPLPVLKLPGKDPIGSSPDWLTFTPDGKTVYVSDPMLRLVSAIDTRTLKEVARIPVGEMPRRLGTVVVP